VELNTLLEGHQKWVDSNGLMGKKIEIEKAIFNKCTINNKKLCSAHMVEVSFDYCNLKNNDMYACYFLSSSFFKADLSESILSKAVFDYASLRYSNMKCCIAIKTSFDCADISNSDLSGSDLRGAILRGADLSNANLQNVDLTSAVLSRALLFGTNFRGAKGVEQVYSNYVFVGTKDEPVRLEGDDVVRWLIEKAGL